MARHANQKGEPDHDRKPARREGRVHRPGRPGSADGQAIGDSGIDLHVWARRPQSLEVLARTRHTVHDSPASLAGAVDILELCLRDDRDIWEVLGTPGVEDALRPGLIVVNHGTGDPAENCEIAEHLAGKTVAYLDAPVSGGGAGARARALTTMVGGDRTAYQKCEDPALGTSAGELARAGIHSHRPSPAHGALALSVTAPVPTATRRRAKPAIPRTPRPRTSTSPPAKSRTSTAWQPNEDATGKPCRSGADGQDAATQAAAVGLDRVTRPVALRQFTAGRSGTRRAL